MTDTVVEHEQGETGGRYIVRRDGHEAEMTYSKSPTGPMIIDHTSVPDAMRGTGAGQAMVLKAVTDARTTGTKILPLCPFAKAQFDKHPDWVDVLHA